MSLKYQKEERRSAAEGGKNPKEEEEKHLMSEERNASSLTSRAAVSRRCRHLTHAFPTTGFGEGAGRGEMRTATAARHKRECGWGVGERRSIGMINLWLLHSG